MLFLWPVKKYLNIYIRIYKKICMCTGQSDFFIMPPNFLCKYLSFKILNYIFIKWEFFIICYPCYFLGFMFLMYIIIYFWIYIPVQNIFIFFWKLMYQYQILNQLYYYYMHLKFKYKVWEGMGIFFIITCITMLTVNIGTSKYRLPYKKSIN